MKKAKTISVVLIVLVITAVIAYMFWPYFYGLSHDFVQIDNEEYFFWPSIIYYSDRDFKKIPLGTTYAEIEKKFGLKNGWYNHSGAVGSYFYIVGPNKYVIINIHASDELIDYVDGLTNEEYRLQAEKLFGRMQLTHMFCATDDEMLWEVTGHLEGFSYLYEGYN